MALISVWIGSMICWSPRKLDPGTFSPGRWGCVR